VNGRDHFGDPAMIEGILLKWILKKSARWYRLNSYASGQDPVADL
jgi:hypothetical protein